MDLSTAGTRFVVMPATGRLGRRLNASALPHGTLFTAEGEQLATIVHRPKPWWRSAARWALWETNALSFTLEVRDPSGSLRLVLEVRDTVLKVSAPDAAEIGWVVNLTKYRKSLDVRFFGPQPPPTKRWGISKAWTEHELLSLDGEANRSNFVFRDSGGRALVNVRVDGRVALDVDADAGELVRVLAVGLACSFARQTLAGHWVRNPESPPQGGG